MHSLQWGRDLAVTETIQGRQGTAGATERFNGAVTLRSRKRVKEGRVALW